MTQTGRASGLDVANIPAIWGWGRPLSKVPPTYCGVIEMNDGGSVITSCRGRWSCSEPQVYLEGRDRDHDRQGRRFEKCGGCDLVAKEQRTRDGLAELRGALVIETRPFPLFDWDLGGEG